MACVFVECNGTSMSWYFLLMRMCVYVWLSCCTICAIILDSLAFSNLRCLCLIYSLLSRSDMYVML